MSFSRILTTATLVAIFSASSLFAQEASPEKSIIRVNSTLQSYNFLRPWEKGAPTPRRGLGALLEGNRVLVTSEMVVNSDLRRIGASLQRRTRSG